MEIPEQLKDVYNYLSIHNLPFLRFVDETPGGTEREVYKELFKVDTYLIHMQSWPIFISRRTLAEIEDTAVKVYRLLKSIPFRVFGGDYQKISDYYEIPLGLVKYFFDGVTQSDLDNLLARGDYIMSPSGLKCIEYNVNTNLGGMETAMWQAAFRSVPIIRRFLKSRNLALDNRELLVLMFRHIIENVLERFESSDNRVNVAYVMGTTGDERMDNAVKVFMESFFNKALAAVRPGLRGTFVFSDYSGFSTAPEGVYYQGTRIHAMVEIHMGYVPPEILEAFRGNKVLIYNGLTTWFMSTKLNLAVLSEHEESDIFTPEERETIKKHIPWTRKVADVRTTYRGKEIDLLDFIYTNRENLVLKPEVGSGGKDIFVGKKTDDAEWKQMVQKSLNCTNHLSNEVVGESLSKSEWDRLMDKALNMEQWLVQERVESYPFIFQSGREGYEPHDGAWGFFVFGDRYCGGWTRILPTSNKKGVVNAHQGAEMAMIIEVDE
jgi:hypothetical protein